MSFKSRDGVVVVVSLQCCYSKADCRYVWCIYPKCSVFGVQYAFVEVVAGLGAEVVRNTRTASRFVNSSMESASLLNSVIKSRVVLQ